MGKVKYRDGIWYNLLYFVCVFSFCLGYVCFFVCVIEKWFFFCQVIWFYYIWLCFYYQSCFIVIFYYSIFKLLVGLLSLGVFSFFFGVCLFYIILLVRYMEMILDEIFNDWGYVEVDFGLEIIIVYLDFGCIFM